MSTRNLRTELQNRGYVIAGVDPELTVYSLTTPAGDESVFEGEDALEQIVTAGAEHAGLG